MVVKKREEEPQTENLQDDWIEAAEAEAIAEDAALAEFFDNGREVARQLDANEHLERLPNVSTVTVEEVPVEPSQHAIEALNDDFISIDGQIHYHRSIDDSSTGSRDLAERLNNGYIQNEEQENGGLWSKIANKSISGDEYVEILKNKKLDGS